MTYNADDDKPTRFTFLAIRDDGSFVRDFENKDETWHAALYEFMMFLKGMGFHIDDNAVQVKDQFAAYLNKDAPLVYDNLVDVIYN